MGIQAPNGFETAQTIVPANDTMEIYQPSAGGTRKNKQISVEQFGKEVNNGGVYLNSSRKVADELTSGTLSTSGWYTIAESDSVASISASAIFQFSYGSKLITALVGFGNLSNIKTRDNTQIEMLDFCGDISSTSSVQSVRLAKSDSVSAGAKVQVKIDATVGLPLNVQMSSNAGRNTGEGWQLVTPYLDNTPTLPDGVTVGTFLEAGAELSFATINTNSMIPNAICRKTSDDFLQVSIMWPELPKQGTSLVITLPSTLFRVYQGDAAFGTITGAHTISNFNIEGKRIDFQLNQNGAFASLTPGAPGWFFVQGTGGKFTIT